MNLFDMFEDKATELLQGATGKVSELTGVELPLGDVVDQAGQAAGGITGAGQNLTDTATGAVTDATGVITNGRWSRGGPRSVSCWPWSWARRVPGPWTACRAAASPASNDQRHHHRGFLRPNDTGHEP
jgi:hypothetical protein